MHVLTLSPTFAIFAPPLPPGSTNGSSGSSQVNASLAATVLTSLTESQGEFIIVTETVRVVAQQLSPISDGSSAVVALPLTDEERALEEAGRLVVPSISLTAASNDLSSGNSSLFVAVAMVDASLWGRRHHMQVWSESWSSGGLCEHSGRGGYELDNWSFSWPGRKNSKLQRSTLNVAQDHLETYSDVEGLMHSGNEHLQKSSKHNAEEIFLNRSISLEDQQQAVLQQYIDFLFPSFDGGSGVQESEGVYVMDDEFSETGYNYCVFVDPSFSTTVGLYVSLMISFGTSIFVEALNYFVELLGGVDERSEGVGKMGGKAASLAAVAPGDVSEGPAKVSMVRTTSSTATGSHSGKYSAVELVQGYRTTPLLDRSLLLGRGDVSLSSRRDPSSAVRDWSSIEELKTAVNLQRLQLQSMAFQQSNPRYEALCRRFDEAWYLDRATGQFLVITGNDNKVRRLSRTVSRMMPSSRRLLPTVHPLVDTSTRGSTRAILAEVFGDDTSLDMADVIRDDLRAVHHEAERLMVAARWTMSPNRHHEAVEITGSGSVAAPVLDATKFLFVSDHVAMRFPQLFESQLVGSYRSFLPGNAAAPWQELVRRWRKKKQKQLQRRQRFGNPGRVWARVKLFFTRPFAHAENIIAGETAGRRALVVFFFWLLRLPQRFALYCMRAMFLSVPFWLQPWTIRFCEPIPLAVLGFIFTSLLQQPIILSLVCLFVVVWFVLLYRRHAKATRETAPIAEQSAGAATGARSKIGVDVSTGVCDGGGGGVPQHGNDSELGIGGGSGDDEEDDRLRDLEMGVWWRPSAATPAAALVNYDVISEEEGCEDMDTFQQELMQLRVVAGEGHVGRAEDCSVPCSATAEVKSISDLVASLHSSDGDSSSCSSSSNSGLLLTADHPNFEDWFRRIVDEASSDDDGNNCDVSGLPLVHGVGDGGVQMER
eukprot:gene26435-31944_t